MTPRSRILLNAARIATALLIACFAILSGTARAEWKLNGIPVCSDPLSQSPSDMISDGSGGAFIIWSDGRGGSYSPDVYAQRISWNGTALWQKDGLPVCTAFRAQSGARMISDGAGGIIVVWTDYRDIAPQVFAQRIDGSGTIQWQQNGVPIEAGVGGGVATDGAGGAFIVFGGETKLNAQRIDGNGNRLWSAGGVSVSTGGFEKYDPAIAADGMGGAIIAWAEQTSSPINSYYVRAQLVTSSGTRYWASNGITLFYSTATLFEGPAVVGDGKGGAFVTAADGNTRIFGRRIRHSGSLVAAAQTLNAIDYLTRSASPLVSDNGGGATAFWGASDLYARRLGGDGLVRWPSEIVYCSQPGTQRDAAATSGDSATAMTAWKDGRSGGYDIYAQKFDTTGAALWQPEGIAVCTAGADQGNPRIVSDMRGGAIVAWSDARSGNLDIYASVVNPQYHPPVLGSIGGRTLEAGESLVIQLAAADPDPGDTLTFATDAGTVLRSLFTFSETTGLFTWTPETSDAGDYTITFSVSDGFHVDEESIVVSVFVNSDRPPVFNAFKDVFVYEGGLVRIVASAMDPEGDPITFSIDDPRYQHSDSIFTWQTAAGDSGDYYPLLTATDGLLSDTTRCAVHVLYFDAQKTPHDRMLGNIHPYYHWREKGSAWSLDSDGYLAGTGSLSSGIISEGKPGAFDSAYAIFRFEIQVQSSYVFGFTSIEPDNNDFNRGNVDFGLHCSGSGDITPSWANDLTYWNGKMIVGRIFDCRITLNRNENTVRFDFERVDSVRAPVSDFVEPYWSVVESRPVSSECYLQINMSSAGGRLYDVWAGSGSEGTGTLLAGYFASREGTSALVQWTLSSPVAGLRFAISRWSNVENRYVEIENPVIQQDGLTFSYRDTRIESGATYRYRVLAESEDGREELFETEPISIPVLAPALYQNYPNPFNPFTAIRFYLPNKMNASVDIYDIGGRHIVNLLDGKREAGMQSISWDGRNRAGIPVSAGVYFCRLRADKTTISRKIILVR
jgi:hypothetical protein